ncbi:MAG: hypothetical protein DRP08_01025 [Candidatus Aenigmatarchaeota archaeon]|nr:hypothetical protein [Candidatus Aenigmarchaeota archaeon]RLJ04739.1 MAG: hypothetical protein DRP08_01025 [Candidatus Aenigmarchaeota archaeon]
MKACRSCKRIVSGKTCPVCKTSDLTSSFQGIIQIFDPNGSEIAKKVGITAPGKYAIRA